MSLPWILKAGKSITFSLFSCSQFTSSLEKLIPFEMFLYIRMRYFASQHFAYARVMILPSWVTSLLTALSRWCIGRESTCQCRSCRGHEFDSWVGKIPGEGNGNPLQYSCLRNPIDRGAWWAAVHGVTKVQTWLSNWAHISTCFCSKITWLENNLYS